MFTPEKADLIQQYIELCPEVQHFDRIGDGEEFQIRIYPRDTHRICDYLKRSIQISDAFDIDFAESTIYLYLYMQEDFQDVLDRFEILD